MDDSGKFLSLTAFQTIHDLTARPSTFLGIISSIKLLQRYIPHNIRTSIKHESFLLKFLKSKNSSRLAYKKLISGKSESPNQSQQKTKLVPFNFQFLHRRISTNIFQKKIGLVDSDKCTFCERETEKLAHLFWACSKTQYFWTNFKVLPSHCQRDTLRA